MRAEIELPTYDDDLYAYAYAGGEWVEDEYGEAYAGEAAYYPAPRPGLLDYVNSYTVVAFLLLLVFVYGALHRPTAVAPNRTTVQATAVPAQPAADSQSQPKIDVSGDPTVVMAPYTNYQITQGLHGYSYGHMAIDLAAGRGEPVLSPINGVVTAVYMDEYGNPTLVIENDVYQILLLHGDYSAQVGDELRAGQQVGVESNKGYTMDMQGNLCYNREWCGNHTHLNVYDKRLRSNVNPFDLIGD